MTKITFEESLEFRMANKVVLLRFKKFLSIIPLDFFSVVKSNEKIGLLVFTYELRHSISFRVACAPAKTLDQLCIRAD